MIIALSSCGMKVLVRVFLVLVTLASVLESCSQISDDQNENRRRIVEILRNLADTIQDEGDTKQPQTTSSNGE